MNSFTSCESLINRHLPQLALALASLGCGLAVSLPAQAGESDWQSLCREYYSAQTCFTDFTADAWELNQAEELAAKLPTVSVETSPSSLLCFMRNFDGTILDLSQLCRATSAHPFLAQISVINPVREKAKTARNSTVFTFR